MNPNPKLRSTRGEKESKVALRRRPLGCRLHYVGRWARSIASDCTRR